MEEENKFAKKKKNSITTSPWSPGKGIQVLYSSSKLDHVSNMQLVIRIIS